MTDELIHRGVDYRLTLGDGHVVYSAGSLRFAMPLVDLAADAGADRNVRPLVFIPRPELWNQCSPPWLRDRDGDVVQALQEHTDLDVVYGPDDLYRPALGQTADTTSSTRGSCPVCDPEVVAPEHPNPYRRGEMVLDLTATQAAVEERLADGRFEVIRADFPVASMLDELERDVKYTIVSFLRCTVSDEVVFWGLSIRGAPIYRHHAATSPFTWPWEAPHPLVDTTPDRPELRRRATPGPLADRDTIHEAYRVFRNRPAPTPVERRRTPDRDVHLGLGYSIAEGRDHLAYLVPLRGRAEFPRRQTDRKPEVLLPRPELWDRFVPRFLRGRRDVVAARLRAHSGHDVTTGPDELFPPRDR